MPYDGLLGAANVDLANVDTSTLDGKMVFLDFTPCRAFTPKLAEFYAALGGKTEIVFGSSDRDEAGFEDYFGIMPSVACTPFR